MNKTNQQQAKNQGVRVDSLITVVSALFAVCLISSSARAQSDHTKPCRITAGHILKSNLLEASEDYWSDVADASTLNSRSARRAAYAEARNVREETKEEAMEQYEARLELCEKLNERRYHPEINPDDFMSPEEIAANPNPYWPLVPGTKYTYQGETEEGTEVIEITITDQTREILGVDCVAVEDIVFLDGEKIEDTRDYYAQKRDTGDVWYFGENTFELEDGLIVELAGAWIAGEAGGKPGILTKAEASVGDVHRQEMLLGEAEDYAEVLGLSETVTVPAGTFENCRRTFEGTPLESDAMEHKVAAPGVGVILELDVETGERVELISFEPPSP